MRAGNLNSSVFLRVNVPMIPDEQIMGYRIMVAQMLLHSGKQ